ncbi:MAG: hypothetical protein AB1726_08135 [Planctomycetota bacterium]
MSAGAILLIAAVLRFAPVRDDLWLDEIRSVQVAGRLSSPGEALTLHHEINHHLNTWWLHLVGPQGTPLACRFLSLLAGIGSVAVAGQIGRRHSPATGLLAMILFAVSYELVLFSAEARGYSVLVFCSLLSFLLLESLLARPTWRRAAGYATCATVGLLLLDLRYVVPGGGTPADSWIHELGLGLAWALGPPGSPAFQLLGCILAVIVLDGGLRWLRRGRGDAGIFFAGVIVAFPVLILVARGSEYVYTRHFLVGAAFLLLLLGTILGSWWSQGAGGKVLCLTVLFAYTASNLSHVTYLLTHGRGRHCAAIRYIAEHTPGPVVSIGGDSDHRIGLELSYYLPEVLKGRAAEYYELGSWPAGGPRWVITHGESYEPPAPVGDTLSDDAGNRYALARTFPTAPLSGLHWYVFRNLAPD